MRSGKLRTWGIAAFCIAAVVASNALADTEGAVRDVLKTMSGPDVVSNPRSSTTPEGYLKFLAAPAGNSFEPSSSAKSSGGADAVAKSFLQEHADAFGIHQGVTFTTNRVKTQNARTFVKLDQTYKGVPIFGAQANVQMKPDGGVVSLLSDIMRDAPRVYSGELSLSPTLNQNDAKLAAVGTLLHEHPGYTFDTNTPPKLYLYVPYVMGNAGQVKLVYEVKVHSIGPGMPVGERMLIDAHNGTAALRVSMIQESRFRVIFDADNVPFIDPGDLVRFEGDPATGIPDVDNAYDFYGNTYDFYFNEHGRDSIDDFGLVMDATTRFCPDRFNCPFFNAFWDDFFQRMYFGDGFTADDVVGHELTHGVTSHESNLFYGGESGALNESFSDVWGEFIDQTNGLGTDTPAVKWLLGEDVPGFGAIRNMRSPTDFQDPEVYLGDFWKFDPFFDNGGVHSNSGVSNKLAYLLTDGDTFRGITIAPMGISLVADLYYECQTNLLTPLSDYPDFGNQMLTAADNLGLTATEKENIAKALHATEIHKVNLKPLRHFRATGKSGDARVALTWKNPSAGDFTGVVVVRNLNRFPNNASDGTVLATITNGSERLIDSPGLGAGTNVYYGLFPRPGSFPENLAQFSRVTIGVDVDFLSEGFTNGTDLANSQLTFVPTGAVPITGAGTQRPQDYFNYTTYAAHAASDSKIAPTFDGTLPVAKEDFFLLPMADDGTINFTSSVPIPFFGQLISDFIISANGYISGANAQYATEDVNSTITLESYFDIPRIAFLYSDLSPRSGGEVWARFMDDRIVVTFENVPSYDNSALGQPGESFANTVQCEIFYGGQIRFTYLDLTAERAVVGLSDGHGIPLDVDDVLANRAADPKVTDLDSLPGAVPLELQPIPIKIVEPGTIVAFTAEALSTQGAPTFSMISPPDGLGVSPIPGSATLNPSTGEFSWDTTGFVDGTYGAILCASAGQFSSCQVIAIALSTSAVVPTATGLSLTPPNPRDADNLVASYTYNHPSLPEGPTNIYWFKNNAIVPAYNNHTLLPRIATHPGDLWYFQVLPATIPIDSLGGQPIFLRGAPVLSDSVTIEADVKLDTNGDGKVNSVDVQLVVRGLLGTSGPGVDPDVNGDGKEDASDIQTTINYILEKQ